MRRTAIMLQARILARCIRQMLSRFEAVVGKGQVCPVFSFLTFYTIPESIPETVRSINAH
jgi:hypothetical protein